MLATPRIPKVGANLIYDPIKRAFDYKGVNYKLQGSAAEIMKAKAEPTPSV